MLTHILFSSLNVSMAVDSIGVSQSLSDGMTLVSQGGTFELGFFSPGTSQKRYLGIWYKSIPVQTVVWVANRANPINGSSGILTLNSTGNLVLRQNDSIVWYATTSQKQAKNPVAELLDSGNLVVRNDGEAKPKAYLWQSFDYPSDTQLPGMKMGRDLQHGFNWRLTSWKSPDDPSPGHLSLELVLSDYPEFSMMNGTKKFSRTGPWNGLYFNGRPNRSYEYMFRFIYVANKDEISSMGISKVDSVLSRIVINETSHAVDFYVWVEKDKNWNTFDTVPSNACDNYDRCGAYGYCIAAEAPICQCLKGFNQKSPQEWNSSNWAQGCVRNEPLSCNVKSIDGFVKYTDLKIPDTARTRLVKNINLEDCKILCLKNCSCMAYANSDIRGGGSGCVMWFGDLIDIELLPDERQDLYIRMSASEIGKE